jgi:hypothetical protein
MQQHQPLAAGWQTANWRSFAQLDLLGGSGWVASLI